MHAWNSFSKLSQRILRRLRQERGQALVEFAIILPVLVLLILGIIYFGRYEGYSNSETQLAEQGARQAAVDVTPGASTSLQTYIAAQAPGELQSATGDVAAAVAVYIYYPTSTTTNPNPGTVGSQVRACVTATVKLPFLGAVTQQMIQSATMRIEVPQTAAEWTPVTPAASTGCPLP